MASTTEDLIYTPKNAETPPYAPDAVRDLFAALRGKGLLTNEGEICCSTCSSYELGTEIEERNDARIKGYAYYHVQNTQGGYDRLMLGYGSADEGDEARTEIGELIVSTAEEIGIETEWDGSPDYKIEALFGENAQSEVWL